MTEKLPPKYQDKLNQISVTIDNEFRESIIELKGVDVIKEYLEKEREYWSKIDTKTNIVKEIISYYNEINNKFTTFIANIQTYDDSNYENTIKQLINNLTKQRTVSGFKVIPSDTGFAKYILDFYNENPNQADIAYRFYTEPGNSKIENIQALTKDGLGAFIKIYQFEQFGDTKYLTRSEAEHKNIKSVLNELSQNSLNMKSQLNAVDTELEHFKIKLSRENDQWKNERSRWSDQEQTKISNQINKGNKKLNELEELYIEKLRLEAPVKYWETRAEKHRKESAWWLRSLIVVVIVLGILFTIFLYKFPPALELNAYTLDIKAIKALVILLSVVSLGAYLVRTFSKLLFSSLHLQRDAEERQQLTYVYLAMLKDSSVKEDDRNIILQSLFSRVDTGLLGSDSSPSMPSEAIINRVKGSE